MRSKCCCCSLAVAIVAVVVVCLAYFKMLTQFVFASERLNAAYA